MPTFQQCTALTAARSGWRHRWENRTLPGSAIVLELEKLLFIDKRWRVGDTGLFGDVDDCL
jgi:hypothetical protein